MNSLLKHFGIKPKKQTYDKTIYKFNPVIAKWIDSINTVDQLSNAGNSLPLFGETNEEKRCIKLYLWLRGVRLQLNCISEAVSLLRTYFPAVKPVSHTSCNPKKHTETIVYTSIKQYRS